MVVEPAAGDLGEPVEPGDARLREEPSEHVADDTANGVRGEDLHSDRTGFVSFLSEEGCRDETRDGDAHRDSRRSRTRT